MKHILSDRRKSNGLLPRLALPALAVAVGVAGGAIFDAQAQETNLLRQGIDEPNTTEFSGPAVEGVNDTAPVFTNTIDTNFDNGTAAADLSTPASGVNSASSNASSSSNTNLRTSATLRQTPVGELDVGGLRDPRGNRPATTVEGGGTAFTNDPYAATGLRVGTFDLFPTMEQGIGYSSNANEDENGEGAGFSQTSIGLRLQSNWSIHQLQAELGATYQRFFEGESEALPTANANATLRLDVGQEYTTTIRGAYNLVTESASSSNLATGSTAVIIDRPNVETLSTSVELARTAGKLRFSLRGSLDKALYEDATLSDGTNLLQGDRDNLLSSGTVRLSYQISPAVTPFVEGSIGQRVFDIKIDSNGNQRDSITHALRGGLELDFGEKLTGQVALGYTSEDFNDNRIATLSGLTFDSSLVWSPLRLTTITTTVATTLVGSSNINDNGSILYSGTLGISRQVRPQLTLDANLTASLQEFDTSGRRDVTLGVNAGYTYWFNRFIAATGRASYQTVDSNEPGSSYDVGTVILGLRFQR